MRVLITLAAVLLVAACQPRIPHRLPSDAPCQEMGNWLLCNARDAVPYEAAARKAAELAAKWDFGPPWPAWWPDLVVFANVTPEPGDENAYGRYYRDRVAIILLDETKGAPAQVAQTTFHELWHAVLHQALGWDISGNPRHDHPSWWDIAYSVCDWPCSWWQSGPLACGAN